MRGGHECVVHDLDSNAIAQLARDGATGAAIARGVGQSIEEAARGLAHGSGGCRRVNARRIATTLRIRRHHHRRRQLALSSTICAGPRELSRQGRSLRRRRHQRRRLGIRSRLLPDDRRRTTSIVRHLIRFSKRWHRGPMPRRRRPAGHRGLPPPPSGAICTAVRPAPDIS